MNEARLWAVEWHAGGETLTAIEPTHEELRRAAPDLAAFYNDPHNAQMMAHGAEPHTAADVMAYYATSRGAAGRPFLLESAGALLGDADFRNIEGPSGEFAIMIGARSTQGRGLGTRFATMLHLFGFGVLALERIYVSIIPGNAASRRLFEKLGYEIDDSSVARAFVDDESDVTMSVSRAAFEGAHAEARAAVRLLERAASKL